MDNFEEFGKTSEEYSTDMNIDSNPFRENFNKEDVANRDSNDKIKKYIISEKNTTQQQASKSNEQNNGDKFTPKTNKSRIRQSEQYKGNNDEIKKRLINDFDLDLLLDNIVNMNDETRLNKKFLHEYGDVNEIELDDEKRLQGNFRDYLVLPKISGMVEGLDTNNIIPEQKAKFRGEKVEISDDPITDEHNGKSSTIMINRTENGDVESIEVYCSCGEKTLVKFDIEEDNPQNTGISQSAMDDNSDFSGDFDTDHEIQ